LPASLRREHRNARSSVPTRMTTIGPCCDGYEAGALSERRAIPADPRGSVVSRVRWSPSNVHKGNPPILARSDRPASISRILAALGGVAPAPMCLILQPVRSWAPFEDPPDASRGVTASRRTLLDCSPVTSVRPPSTRSSLEGHVFRVHDVDELLRSHVPEAPWNRHQAIPSDLGAVRREGEVGVGPMCLDVSDALP